MKTTSREGRTDGQTTGHARAKECKEKLDPTETRPKVTGLKGGDQGVEFCCAARLWETTPQKVSLSFHPWSSTGSGSVAAAARGRCHFQNKKGNSVSIREGRTEQRRGFRSSNSKRTRLKKREGGKESYFHSVTRKGKREYPWVGDRLW